MGDRMSVFNWLGFSVCLSGISLHVGLKVYASKSRASVSVLADHSGVVSVVK